MQHSLVAVGGTNHAAQDNAPPAVDLQVSLIASLVVATNALVTPISNVSKSHLASRDGCIPHTSFVANGRSRKIQLMEVPNPELCFYDILDRKPKEQGWVVTPRLGEAYKVGLWEATRDLWAKVGTLLHDYSAENPIPWVIIGVPEGELIEDSLAWRIFIGRDKHDVNNPQPYLLEWCLDFVRDVHEAVVKEMKWVAEHRGVIHKDLNFDQIYFLDDWAGGVAGNNKRRKIAFGGWFPETTEDWEIGKTVPEAKLKEWSTEVNNMDFYPYDRVKEYKDGEKYTVKGVCKSGPAPNDWP